ncbi:MAG TPA: hypothetical protein VF571_05190 [Pyrinomonadaceae bacterium]|jgi:hypothetical protein
MKNLIRICCAFFIAAIFALSVPFSGLNASTKPANKQKKKSMVVLRLKDRAHEKPTAQEVNEFGVTPQGRKAKQIMAFKEGHDLLKQKGVKFDPNILLYANWREKLRDTMATDPEFQENRRGTSKLKGAQLADTLVLPEQVELTGDTVIVAKNLILEGRNVVIKGNHDVHVFTVNPIIQVEQTASAPSDAIFAPASFSTSFNLNRYLKTVRIVQNGSVTVDTSGIGRKEWLENRARMAQAVHPSGARMTKINFNPNAKPLSFLLDTIDTSGNPGADGANGDDGNPGQPGDSPTGKVGNGSCTGNRNGDDGRWGIDGGTGQEGGDGKPGVEGGDASDINLPVSSMTATYTLRANGGEGGKGGKGGTGGSGGRGGNGSRGGDGADCPCHQGGGGSGGDGGNAGAAGNGGKGGSGGDGGPGGDAGTIVVTHPSGYDTQKVDAQAKVGAGGGVQGKGQGGYYGTPGTPGDPGKGAGPLECHGADGSVGQSGGTGSFGEQGAENGTPGTPGAEGNISFQLEQGGGGGAGGGVGGQYYYYYNPNMGCTEYYWVQYLSYDGGKTWEQDPMWSPAYAGCW